ncbi:MAG: hypothetical protein HY753_08005 [Nitrospirae bacterium]|nr:hypothetical protein [Nitrospirota bacterium]
MVEQITDAPKYNSETVKTVLNVLQKEFEAEQERDRFITSKVQMMLTLAGILLTHSRTQVIVTKALKVNHRVMVQSRLKKERINLLIRLQKSEP